jgi:hypothetical protein
VLKRERSPFVSVELKAAEFLLTKPRTTKAAGEIQRSTTESAGNRNKVPSDVLKHGTWTLEKEATES